jgi:hypothetical protein
MNTLRLSLWTMGFAVLGVGISGSVGCGEDDAPIPAGTATCSGDCECVGDTCKCRTGGTCTFGAEVGADGGDGGAAAPADNVTYQCESKNTCDATCGTNCTTTCEGQSTCVGSCESNCTSTCGGTSTCTLETGVNSNVTCTGGSDCTVTLDTGSKLTCEGNSKCTIKCPQGGCTAECGGSAGCRVECGGTTACAITCNGQKSDECAAGSTCESACGTRDPDSGLRDATPDGRP